MSDPQRQDAAAQDRPSAQAVPAMPEASSDTLDLTDPDAGDTAVVAPRLGNDYDPRPHEDQARRHIAYLLIGLLWIVVAGLLILVAWGGIQVQDIKDFAVLLGPVVTLVSAATGFYYGTKSK